jgi:hypothetical protein
MHLNYVQCSYTILMNTVLYPLDPQDKLALMSINFICIVLDFGTVLWREAF